MDVVGAISEVGVGGGSLSGIKKLKLQHPVSVTSDEYIRVFINDNLDPIGFVVVKKDKEKQ